MFRAFFIKCLVSKFSSSLFVWGVLGRGAGGGGGEGVQTQSLEQARQALYHGDTSRSGFLNFPCYSVLEMEIEKTSSRETKHVGGASSLALSFLSSYLQALGRHTGTRCGCVRRSSLSQGCSSGVRSLRRKNIGFFWSLSPLSECQSWRGPVLKEVCS